MGNCLPVSRDPGNSSHNGDLELSQVHSEVTTTMTNPLIQYPIDDTMPVKAWIFEKLPAPINRYKPLRPEDERKALEAINRHLPPWDQIEIPDFTTDPLSELAIEVINRHLPPWDQIKVPKQSLTGPETAPSSKRRLYPDNYLPLPPRGRNRRERLEAVESHGLPKAASLSNTLGKKPVRRGRSKNWIQTEEIQEGHDLTEEMKDGLPTPIVPDLIVTRTDGETRRLRDPNVYVGGE